MAIRGGKLISNNIASYWFMDLDSMKPVYVTSFAVEAPDKIKMQTSRGKPLKTAEEPVIYSFHSKSN